MKKYLLVLMIMFGATVMAQDKNAKATVEVDGVCMMCKARIEKAAIKTKGVKSATWNVETHQLTLFFDERKTNLETIQENIAAVGHDTGKFTAPNEVYEAIDACCKYRDPSVIEDHKDGKQH